MDYQAFVEGDKTLLIAPAGFGKTYTIVESLKYTTGRQLILTHTHAGVAAIKEKIKNSSITSNQYSVETISSFAQKYVTAFYIGTDVPDQESAKDYHPFIIAKAIIIFKSNSIKDVLKATYNGLFVDEYQDCTKPQHKMVLALSESLKTHILGDPLQGIFDFNGDLVDFDVELSAFERLPDLFTPHRWHRCNRVSLGDDLKNIREKLEGQHSVELNNYSQHIEICHVKASDMYVPNTIYNQRLQSLRNEKNILVIHPISGNKAPRISFIKKFRDFYLVESIDDPDFYNISKQLDSANTNISAKNIRDIAYKLFGKTGLNEWFNLNGFKNKQSVEGKAVIEDIQKLIDNYSPYYSLKVILLAVKNLPNVKCYQVDLFYSLIKAINISFTDSTSVYEAMKVHRNTIRRSGKRINGKCIGTTLLTKGLEFDTVAILDAHKFDCPKNLYVALTRCCKKLIIFSSQDVLSPY